MPCQFDRQQQPALYTYKVVRTLPHDTTAFTEGLEIHGGFLYESTGLEGKSFIGKRTLENPKYIQKVPLENRYFGEGITIFGDKLYQLTWQHQKGFVYDLESLKRIRTFDYYGEGWALTHDEDSLIMSDGTDTIRFLDPKTLKVRRRLKVVSNGQPVTQINELEWVKGEIFANIWQTDYVVRIHPQTGQVTGVIDFKDLLPFQADVLNGIAYDAKTDKLYVTGKLWKSLFEVKLIRK